MRRFAFFLALAASLASHTALAGEPIGSKQISIPDPGGERPLQARLWYPAGTSGPLTSIGGRDGSFRASRSLRTLHPRPAAIHSSCSHTVSAATGGT